MLDDLRPFLNQCLRRVVYYRSEFDANIDLNWSGFHDVGQGVELSFDGGHFFVTWDNTVEEDMSVHSGRMVDFLSAGIFEDVTRHLDWKDKIGHSLAGVRLLQNEVVLHFAEKQVSIVTARVDRLTLRMDAMADNLVVMFHPTARDAFFARYPDAQTT
ncbi:hypothetical protein [Deinococcus ruber]|uniref:Uncharacterized protein n=1 Tax=Deinococcus ruber TaxID=1848197 RepID=A0A918CBX5_9DEIO|nr:hypothetical protein [Deinococcus ruber]GGR17409.1 hypothetical protein GCM10008957_32610 [Deinococcus ruber]